MGGGTASETLLRSSATGLSPRGRGNHDAVDLDRGADRSIPAWAGEPSRPRVSCGNNRVYPRVGGGTDTKDRADQFHNGLSRVGGGTWKDKASDILLMGLSPRGRGNLPWALVQLARHGSIPAWAGEPRFSHAQHKRERVYPRVGGGTSRGFGGTSQTHGLSPRGRGNRQHRAHHQLLQRSIPAWAGEPRWAN